jgi:Tfp pilus assembly protein PilX
MKRGRAFRRRAAVLLVVLACLLVVGVVGAGLVRTMIDTGHAHRLHVDRLQAQWLAESGVDRAIAQMRQDKAYAGETWKIDAEQLDGRRGAVVEIAVERASENETVGRITAKATLGAGAMRVSAEANRILSIERSEPSP